MKKNVSFSLFGGNPRYTINALINADLCSEYYPDWSCRIYHDDSVPTNVLTLLKNKSNVDLKKTTGHGQSRRMWRFLAYDDSDIVICRDIDSHITKREVSAVHDWLNTNKNLHVMRDHRHHGNCLQAGMFGLKKNSKLVDIQSIYKEFISNNKDNYSMDEKFLREKIYHLFKDDMVVHDALDRFNDKTHDWKVEIEYTDVHGQFVGRDQYPPSNNIDLFHTYERLLT